MFDKILNLIDNSDKSDINNAKKEKKKYEKKLEKEWKVKVNQILQNVKLTYLNDPKFEIETSNDFSPVKFSAMFPDYSGGEGILKRKDIATINYEGEIIFWDNEAIELNKYDLKALTDIAFVTSETFKNIVSIHNMVR